MADTSKQIIQANGLSDVIEVIHAKVEDIDKLPGGIEKVSLGTVKSLLINPA